MATLEHLNWGGGAELQNTVKGRCFNIHRRIDCSEVNVDSGDVVKLLEVPKDVLVMDVVSEVLTAEGDAGNYEVGDYNRADDTAKDADQFLATGNTDINSTGVTKYSDNNTGGGKVYNDETAYIGFTPSINCDAAVIDVDIVCIKLK